MSDTDKKENRPKYTLNKSPTSTGSKIFTFLVILTLLVSIIVTETPYVAFDSDSQKGVVGTWISLLGLYFICVLIIVFVDTKYVFVQGLLITLLLLQMIFSIVMTAMSEPKLETKEKVLLYTHIVLLHLALIFYHASKLFKHKYKPKD